MIALQFGCHQRSSAMPKLRGFKSRLRLELTGRTWRNLDAGRCSTPGCAATAQKERLGRTSAEPDAKLWLSLEKNGNIEREQNKALQLLRTNSHEGSMKDFLCASKSLVNHASHASICHRRWPIQWRGCWNSMQRLRESTTDQQIVRAGLN